MVYLEYMKVFSVLYLISIFLLYIFFRLFKSVFNRIKEVYVLYNLRNPEFYRSFIMSFLLFVIFLFIALSSLIMLFLSYRSFSFSPNALAEIKAFNIERLKDGNFILIDGHKLNIGSRSQNIKIVGVCVYPPFNLFSEDGAGHFYGIAHIRPRETRHFTTDDIYADREFISIIPGIDFFSRAIRFAGYSVEIIESPPIVTVQGEYRFRATRYGYILIGI